MTNDEGQMTNRWGKLKVSRRWVIVLLALVIASLVTYTLFRKPPITLQVVELKQELRNRLYPIAASPASLSYDIVLEPHCAATLELRNNSSDEIQYWCFASEVGLPSFDCLYWTGAHWTNDLSLAASTMGMEQKRVGGAGSPWKPAILAAGASIRFKVVFLEPRKPSFVALPFRTTRQANNFYDRLPSSVIRWLPWRKERHQAQTEVILNGAKELPPCWNSKPDINKRSPATLPR